MTVEVVPRKERFDRGLCDRCGVAPRRPDRTMCLPCATARAAYVKEWAAKRLAEGKCRQCGKPRASSRQCCTACCRKQQEAKAKLHKERLARKRCVICNEATTAGRKKCGQCQAAATESVRLLRERRREAGECLRCGTVPVEGTLCHECRTDYRDDARLRRSSERTYRCGRCGQEGHNRRTCTAEEVTE